MRAGLLALIGSIAVGSVVVGGSLLAAPSQAELVIQCTFAHRQSVTTNVRIGPVIRLSSSRRTMRGRAGAFGFRATIGEEPGAEPSSLSIRVWGRNSGTLVASGLYQFREGGPSNQFRGGHGFTGLVYAYLPSGAELQYFCRAH